MVDPKGQETKEPNVETIQPQQEVVTPPAAEPTLQELQAQLAETQKKFEQADKGLRSAQATLTQKDRQIKEQADLRSEIDVLKEMVKIAAVHRGSQLSEDELDDPDTIRKKLPDLDKAYADIEAKVKTRKQQEEYQAVISSFQTRVSELGLTESDEAFWEIGELVTTGTPFALKRAELKISKLEKEKTVDKKDVPTDTKTKSLEDRLAALERENKILKGELDVEDGQPAGGSKAFTRKQINEMSVEEYAKNRDEIQKAISAGRVK
jgi:uncharacterized coiled-coil protein SlyX